jgi:chromosome segregation ATPase
LKFDEKDLNEKNFLIRNNVNKSEKDIEKFKTENNNLIQQINELNEKNKEYMLEIMEHKNMIEMMNNNISQSEVSLRNKDAVIDQLRNQIKEMNNEIDEKMNDLQIYEDNNKREIDDYISKIEELLQEKNALEIQNSELTKNLSAANDTLKEYNDLVTNKFKEIENELLKEQQNNIKIEKKYKDKITSLKMKFNNLQQNNILKGNKKHLLSNLTGSNFNINNTQIYDNNIYRNNRKIANLTNLDNYMNQTMFNLETNRGYNPFTDVNLTQPNILKTSVNTLYNKNIYPLTQHNSFNKNIDDDSHLKQKELIKEFKLLLKRMDEKLKEENNNI